MEDDKGEMTGVVKFFEGDFGFIQSDDPDLEDVYIHYSNIEPWNRGYKNLKSGQSVKFMLVLGDRGLQAKELVIHPDDKIRDVSKFGEERLEWKNQKMGHPMGLTTQRMPHSKFQTKM